LPLHDQASSGTADLSIPVNFPNDEKIAAFRADSDGQRSATLCSLRDWLVGLEDAGQDVATLDFACHEVTAQVQKDSAGDILGRSFNVKAKEQCAFVPTATPRKLKSSNPPNWEDAGSYVIAGGADGWDLQASGCHKLGYLQLFPRWLCTRNEQMQAVTPEKPGIFFTGPVEFKKGQLVQLA
jgi:hypothetical protein